MLIKFQKKAKIDEWMEKEFSQLRKRETQDKRTEEEATEKAGEVALPSELHKGRQKDPSPLLKPNIARKKGKRKVHLSEKPDDPERIPHFQHIQPLTDLTRIQSISSFICGS